jgi:carboxypeptidase Taq
VAVAEVPEVWNDTFESYLGIRPKDDAEGALQDVHWSGGSFGYFATYTLGNIVAAMIWHEMGRGALVKEALSGSDIGALKKWLGSKIHRFGAIYPPKELQERVFGESYKAEKLLAYLNQKFLD